MLTEVFGEIMLPKLMSMIINNGVAQRDAGYIIKIGLVMLLTLSLIHISGFYRLRIRRKIYPCDPV